MTDTETLQSRAEVEIRHELRVRVSGYVSSVAPGEDGRRFTAIGRRIRGVFSADGEPGRGAFLTPQSYIGQMGYQVDTESSEGGYSFIRARGTRSTEGQEVLIEEPVPQSDFVLILGDRSASEEFVTSRLATELNRQAMLEMTAQ